MSQQLVHSASKLFINSNNSAYWDKSTSNTSLTIPITPYILDANDPAHFVIGLEQLSVPLALYVFSASNNTIVVNGTSYTIPVGNYSITNLITTLNDDPTNTTNTYTYDANNNKITITRASPSITIGTGTTCSKQLGCVGGQTSATTTLTFTNLVNLTTTSGIIIQIGEQTNNRDSGGAGGGSNNLARVPINVPLYRILTYFNPTPFFNVINKRTIEKITITLLNDDGTPLVLVGNPDWFAVLKIDFVDKSERLLPQTNIQQKRRDLATTLQSVPKIQYDKTFPLKKATEAK